ncbi:MAG: type II toxin-antitoxin system Phd/YefM family antitoxin [Clostridia bacterium]|nr:type II toxin-antitoxin system Phd/YefM family antitoxin [Clostridia bacterium]
MQREMTIQEVQKTLTEDNIEETILLKRNGKNDIVIMNFEEYKKIFEINFIERLKKAEEQIKNDEVTDVEVVFKKMREKYGY